MLPLTQSAVRLMKYMENEDKNLSAYLIKPLEITQLISLSLIH